MTALVTVRGLTARAGDALLLDAVGFDLEEGRVTALVGPSGSGKTTAALSLLGEAGPGVRLTGHVSVGGTAVVDEQGPTAEAAALLGRVVAYMPQHPGSTLNPARRTGSVLAELARLHHPGAAPRDAAAQALAAAQLPRGGTSNGASRTSSPAGSASASRSPRPWCAGRGCSCSTSPAPDWTPWPACAWRTSWPRSPGGASASCCSATTTTWSGRSPTTWSC